MYLDNERRPTLTPQLAWRVAIIGGIALVAFAVIFFRLWYLQVLSGDRYLAEANDNRVREIKVQAPRGEIVDRDGTVLVRNRIGYAVKFTPDKLPETRPERRVVYRRVAKVLRTRTRVIERRVERQLRALPFSTATVKPDVAYELFSYLLERQHDFPGVTIERVFLREYPHAEIGAHLFGTVGEVTGEQLEDERYSGVQLGDRVGQSGIEAEYDRFLRGRNGAARVQVDALGNLNQTLQTRQPHQGRQVRLSVDLDVQQAGQEALAGGTGAGAFAVMDVNSGEVVALGSQPSFDPNVFAKVVKKSDLERLSSEEYGKPLFNRAIQGGYPTGSTFKLLTATAALESGLITPDTVLFDGGELTVGGVTFKNAGGASHGALALRQALTVSSDVFFYQLGRDMNARGMALQKWARRLGIGRLTGVDLPAEASGLLPTPRWRDKLFEDELTDRPWSVGDNINLSVGQGDLQANPLQMAVAYATIANGGRVLRPRLGMRIEDSAGRALQQLEAPTARRLKIDAAFRQAIMEGLAGAAGGPGGTSTPVFEGFPIPIAGKTGTAEKGLGRADQSWYVALAPYPDPKYVVAVTDEAGGFGAETAAPMARRILAELFAVDENKLVSGGGAPELMAAASPVKDFRESGVRLVRFDPLLLLATLGLIGASIYTVGTATQDDIAGDPNYYAYRQAAYAGVGLVLMAVILRFDYSRLREWKLGIYAFAIASILLVYTLGVSARGSRRAIEFGFFNFQASELGKLLLVVALSAFAVDRMRRLGERETTSRIVLLALVPAMLVVAQPDLGSGLVYLAIVLAVLFVAGTKWTHFAALAALGAVAIALVLVAAPAVGVEVLKPYQQDRLTAFLNPTTDPGDEGYQINQSLTAIGSGGKTGRGDEATQTRLDFLPEHHTDFIFSVVGEEFGFVGAALVLSLFALLIWRALRILTMSKNFYGALVAGGITAMLMFQVFVNVGMTIGIMPITGIPLPLMSYGGSSVLTTLMAIGLLQSIHAQARDTAAAKRL